MIVRSLQICGNFGFVITHIKDVELANTFSNLLLQSPFEAKVSIRCDGIHDTSRMIRIRGFSFCRLFCDSMWITDPFGSIAIRVPSNSLFELATKVRFIVRLPPGRIGKAYQTRDCELKVAQDIYDSHVPLQFFEVFSSAYL